MPAIVVRPARGRPVYARRREGRFWRARKWHVVDEVTLQEGGRGLRRLLQVIAVRVLCGTPVDDAELGQGPLVADVCAKCLRKQGAK